jgi:cytochrome c
MAGPVYHFNSELESERKFPAAFEGMLFIFDWERSWIKTVSLSDSGELKEIRPFVPETKLKRPISMEFGPDGALYLIEWGSAWYNNKDSQLSRIEFRP